ncbi:MAG: hypothetical protein KC680_01095 [Candidatus Peregrinibacteria bacterium]|nr:hypothetical protein [Candidatus Peregrinibacteria bacterium]MCB9807911.1 hypothetical protein [Candidatus Peribacteria bacterium]
MNTDFEDSYHQLHSGSAEEQICAAKQLRQHGIAHRGGIFPRGDAKHPGELLISKETQDNLISLLQQTSGTLRNELLLALSNWSDDSVHQVIQEILENADTDDDWQCCILALQTVAGEKCYTLLQEIASNEQLDSTIRDRAYIASIWVSEGGYDLLEPGL